jgi:hypothetical protein
MGIVTLAGACFFAAVTVALLASVVVSAVQCRTVPLFWIFAVISAVAGPIVLNPPLPVNHGGDYGSFGYLFDIAFSKFNLLCFFGAATSSVVALLPVGLLRIMSAVSWGFASSFAARLFYLLNS